MAKQSNIDWGARAELVDWLMQIHIHCRLLPETLFLCINILDRFLCLRPVSINKLQLVGVASFLLASKFEETYSPSVPELVQLADHQYSANDVLKAERFILKTLEWNLSGYANVMGWLRRCSKADDSDMKARTIGKYLCEISCMDWKLLAVRPSLVAAAAMWLARLILGREKWVRLFIFFLSTRWLNDN
jgi:G2/mitotic-specific cyclin 1/2